ncbi:MAG: methyltransferase [Candidatus Acidiferrales bacterium]
MTETASAQAVHEPPAHVVLMHMITARWVSQAIAVAARLSIADQLAQGPRSVAEIERATGAHAPSLYRLLRALASVGIFAEIGDGPTTETAERRFSLTPLAEPLRSDAPRSVRGAAMMFGTEWSNHAWADLLRSVQTGETAFDRVFGEPIFEYLSKRPEAMEVFSHSMKSFTAISQDAIVAAYDFTGIGTLVDVGGGNGSFLAAIMGAHPALRGIVYDTERALVGAKALLDAAGVGGRCQIVAGDFFKSVPSGGDACILKHILHDWSDAESAAILVNCRKALPAQGKLLVVDAVIGRGNKPEFGKLLDLEMLVMAPGGIERTEAEFRKLFSAAGFRLTRAMSTACPFSILEGVPV